MHTPALPGIDEIELAAINLNDGEPDAVDLDTPMDAVERKPPSQSQPRPRLPPPPPPPNGFGMVHEDMLDLEVQQSAPCTPVRTARTVPHHQPHQQHQQQSRSLSVPPPEHRFLPHTIAPPLTPSRSLSLDLAGLGAGAGGNNGNSNSGAELMLPHGLGDTTDAFTLPFLDLHYFQNSAGSAGPANTNGLAAAAGGAVHAAAADARKGLALDLACVSPAVQTKMVCSRACAPIPPRERMHHRGMSAVSPQDLLLNKGSCGDNKRKRASWDGRSR